MRTTWLLRLALILGSFASTPARAEHRYDGPWWYERGGIDYYSNMPGTGSYGRVYPGYSHTVGDDRHRFGPYRGDRHRSRHRHLHDPYGSRDPYRSYDPYVRSFVPHGYGGAVCY